MYTNPSSTYCLIEFFGKQFKISNQGDFFYYTAPSLPIKVGETKMILDTKVMGDSNNTYVGNHSLKNMYVQVKLVEKHRTSNPIRLHKKNHGYKRILPKNQYCYTFKVVDFYTLSTLER